MKYDVFLSICQAEVDGYLPSERQLFANFFSQAQLADELGFGTAWVAETHLSCEIQKLGPHPVIPHFRGEIGLNTDILQLAHVLFAKTRRINVGSAIRNILCNGGPVAHAEAVSTFLALHGHDSSQKRRLNLGFASGRFEFSNRPYGIKPRNAFEELAWPLIKGCVLFEATEIFLRLLNREVLSSNDIATQVLLAQDFRDSEVLTKIQNLTGKTDSWPVAKYFEFEKLGVIPKEIRRELLSLTLGSHDPRLQVLANSLAPVGVFNLSITPAEQIEATHVRMKKHYHPRGGPWRRELMPRTVMLFLNAEGGISESLQSQRAKAAAERAWVTYWQAMEGTLDPMKVEQAVANSLSGHPKEVAEKLQEKYHPDDRLMLWFDFNNHDNDFVRNSMIWFMEKVVPLLPSSNSNEVRGEGV